MEKLKINSVRKNLFFNTLYQTLVTLTPLITVPYVSRVLGAQNIGEYSYILAIVNYFCVFGLLGSSVYGQLAISKTRDNYEERSKVFSTILYSRLITMLLSIILYITFIIVFELKSNLYIILFLYFGAQTVDVAWLFQGLEKFDITVPCSALAKIISIISIFCFVKDEHDLGLYVGLLNGSALIGNLLMWINVKKYVTLYRIHLTNILSSIKSNIIFFIPTVATIIFGSLDKCMIAWITISNIENGCYEQASKIYNMLVVMVTSLTTVMLPRMAYLWKEKDNEIQIKEYLIKTIRYVAILVFPISFGMFIVAPEFVPMFFGKGYEKCIILIRVFSVILIFTCFNSIISNQCMVASGKQNILNRFLIISSCINVLLNYFFIYRLQSVGAALASLCSEGILLIMIIVYNRVLLPIKECLRYIMRYISISIIMSCAILPNKIIGMNQLSTLMFEVSIGVIIYGTCLIAIKDDMIIDFFLKIFKRNSAK